MPALFKADSATLSLLLALSSRELSSQEPYQRCRVPAGVLTASAQLRAPMAPLMVDQLTQNSVPEAWKNGQTTALALSVALSTKIGRPIPWTILRRAIDDAIKARWIEVAASSSVWPCEMAAASTVTLMQPSAAGGMQEPGYTPKPKGVYTSTAMLQPAALQDLVDILPDVVKAAAGVSLQFQLQVALGNGEEIGAGKVEEINKLLESVTPELRVRA